MQVEFLHPHEQATHEQAAANVSAVLREKLNVRTFDVVLAVSFTKFKVRSTKWVNDGFAPGGIIPGRVLVKPVSRIE